MVKAKRPDRRHKTIKINPVMKVRLTFTLDVDVKADDPDQAEQLAKVKADAVIIQTMEATGYRMKLDDAHASCFTGLDDFLNDIRNIIAQ